MTKVANVPEGEIAYANYICSKLEAILRKHKVDFTCEYDYSSLQDVSYSWSNNDIHLFRLEKETLCL